MKGGLCRKAWRFGARLMSFITGLAASRDATPRAGWLACLIDAATPASGDGQGRLLHGVVHRDIKPANVMILRGRHAKIMDFGIARLRISEVQTQAGTMLGSPKYMSPEQITGLRADHRSDIFSLGIVIYELVSGAAPFSAATVTGLMHNIATAAPPPPSSVDRSLPGMLDLIITKALEKEPEARYQDAQEIAADLRACLAQLPASSAAVTPVAEAEKTAKMDILLDTPTVITKPETTAAFEATRVAKKEAAEHTRRTDVASGTFMTRGAVTPLYLSRAFGSAEALQALAAMAEPGGQNSAQSGSVKKTVTAWLHSWNNPDRKIFAAAMLIAIVCAALIALL